MRRKKINRNKSISKDLIFVFLGVALVLTGFYLHKSIDSVNKTVLAIPYLFIVLDVEFLDISWEI